jgi:phosphomannomutase
LFDVKCTQRLAPAIAAAGGVPVMYKTGHSLIKAKHEASSNSPLGGEMSGHIFFKERWYGFDDGTYAGCRLLEILSRSAARPQRRAQRVAHQLFHARAQRALRRGRAAPPHVPNCRLAAARRKCGTRRSTPSTACAWTGPMALA